MFEQKTKLFPWFKSHLGGIPATRGMVAVIVIVVTALIGIEAINQRSAVLAGGRKDTANLASTLIQHAELTFRTADGLLIDVVERIEHDNLGEQNRLRLKALFAEAVRQTSPFVSFAVIDSDGTLIVGSAGEEAGGRLTDRDYFLYHQSHEDHDLHIGAPVRGRNADGWVIPLTRRFDHPDGSFGGVVVAALDPSYFQKFYDGLQLGENGAVLLASLDGKLLVRRPFNEANVGRDMSQSGIFRQLKLAPSGTLETTGSMDGIRRLSSYEKGHAYPIVVAVGQDVEELLGPWKRGLMRRLGEIIAMALLISALGAHAWNLTRSLATDAGKLNETNVRFNAALRNMSQGICMFDQDMRLVVWNDRYEEIYQLPPKLLIAGTSFHDIAAYIDQRIILKENATDQTNAISVAEDRRFELNTRRSIELTDGRVILLNRQPTEEGGWLTTHEDITERQRAEAEIVHLARHDALTGLANRAEFSSRLEEASKRLKRNGGPVTLMLLDLDRFKAVNDTLGHPAGDQLLIEVAGRLKSSLRQTDVLARLGGDEFAIIQEGEPDQRDGAISLAVRIVELIAKPFDINGHQVSVGASIGIALAPEHAVEPDELLKVADLALYDAKAGGRNDFRLFSRQMLEVALAQRAAKSELENGIAREQFELHYQPVVDFKTRTLWGFEALVRWRHPTRGLLGPDEFVPAAESSGLIVKLGEWILLQACTDAASWPAHVKVAINISALQFNNTSLFDVILCTLAATGLAPERLELEITETCLLENQATHLSTLRQLRNLGITIALDDFGKGYSSLNYLINFPFDKIKIDRSFTEGAADHRNSAAVVSSVLALAQGLGIATTAEGIERQEQFEYMQRAGVDFAQGNLIGRPVPISELDVQNATSPRMVA